MAIGSNKRMIAGLALTAIGIVSLIVAITFEKQEKEQLAILNDTTISPKGSVSLSNPHIVAGNEVVTSVHTTRTSSGSVDGVVKIQVVQPDGQTLFEQEFERTFFDSRPARVSGTHTAVITNMENRPLAVVATISPQSNQLLNTYWPIVPTLIGLYLLASAAIKSHKNRSHGKVSNVL